MSETKSSALRTEIRSALANAGLQDVKDDMMSKCMALSTSNAITPVQLATAWEAFSLNKKVTELTDLTFQAYRNAVIKDYDTAVMSRPGLGKRHGLPMVTPDAKRVQFATADTPTSAVDAIASSSRRVSVSPTKIVIAPKAPVIKMPSYEERTSVGKVVVSFHPNKALKAEHTSATGKPRCTISTEFATNVTKPYRHMFTPLEERAKILDNHLISMGEEIVESLISEDIAELEAVGVPRQDKVTCVGRICNEAHEGRINQTSVLLEGSRHFSNGTRINLDLTHLKDSKLPYSLFPGQVVAVEGMNVSGRKMVPSRIFCGATPAPTKSKASELMRLHHDLQDGQPLKLLTACGPYTTSDNLEYAPLMDLMAIIRAQKPDVVIMSGPFVHISNAETTLELDDGSKMQVTYEVFFANKFAALVEELFEKEPGMQTQFVLAPSLDDAVAEWVFPQAPLADRSPKNGKMLNLPGAEGIEVGKLGLHHVENAGREGGGPRRVHCVSNPCTLKINEVVIGITSNDTIFQMSADETNANLEPGSRLTRIAQHLLQQRSYYPLFPPPLGTNLDLKQLQHCQMPCRPDILIVPSKLTCFARAVCDSTLVVNPGHLAKGTTGGTYAVMNIYPMQREALENAGSDEVEVEHAIQDRVSIEIKRI